MNLTLMSLFDGSGGFPLAGAIHGIMPVYASEIEPYPIAVSKSHFPYMKHLGSVTEIDGAELDSVDVVTFGSPCQDLSVAGLQKGIHDGARSNLFFQAVRIIKEMRDKDARTGRTNEHIRPRFAVWENVPGAYSSNGGHDFQAVLQALAEIADPDVSIPFPEKGKWTKAGCIVGDGWSIAWRTLDAQFCGVPQRRKRIYLIADFGSERAGEILFERTGMQGHSEPCAAKGQGTAEDSQGSVGRSGNATVAAFMGGQGAQAGSIAYTENCSPTLRATESGSNQVPDVIMPNGEVGLIDSIGGQAEHCWIGRVGSTLKATHCKSPLTVAYTIDGRNAVLNTEKSGTLQAKPNGGFSHNFINPVVYDARGNGDGETSPCLTGDHENRVTDYTAVTVFPKVTGALCANSHPGSYTGQDAYNDMLPVVPSPKPPRKWIVRRLMPVECARLQGFPDCWGVPEHKDSMTQEEMDFWESVRKTHCLITGKTYKPMKNMERLVRWYNNLHTDSAEYKMWGNGIALPCAAYVMGRIAKEVETT